MTAIERACLSDTRYDHQCEGLRDRYILDLMRLSGRQAYLRERVLERLGSIRPDDDADQMFSLAVRFSEAGDDHAANVMRSAVRRMADLGNFEWVEYAVQLDGV